MTATHQHNPAEHHSGHHHHHHAGQDIKVLRRAFFLIASFMLIELVVGLWANALVLIADAGHMFLDAAALGLSKRSMVSRVVAYFIYKID